MESLDLKRNRARVKTLLKKPQPEQRTPEWYAARYSRITASEAASCLYKTRAACEEYVKQFKLKNFKYKDTESLNHYEKREDYIIKKCAGFYGEDVFKDSVYTLWGKKYEEVANRLYCQLYNTIVHEFGLIAHSRLRWLAASPDGITPDGVMLEIKCPKSRKIIENEVPIGYWTQTQIQLEVADLDICHFFECEIDELETEVEFIEKVPGERQSKGIILQIQKHGEPKFVYPPIEIKTTEEYINWKNTLLQQDSTLTPIYFFIRKYNNQIINRSKVWFDNVKEQIKQTWDIIMNLQSNKENFMKYKQSIHEIRSKDFYDKFNTSVCEIDDDDSTFVFESDEDSDEELDEELYGELDDKQQYRLFNDNPKVLTMDANQTICLIED